MSANLQSYTVLASVHMFGLRCVLFELVNLLSQCNYFKNMLVNRKPFDNTIEQTIEVFSRLVSVFGACVANGEFQSFHHPYRRLI